jgi:branched-chain amino acid transport system ATP-binding protein
MRENISANDQKGQKILEVKKLTKNFGGLAAVKDLDFDVYRGEILGLIGPNGAGKTTIFNLICGVYPETSGKIIFNGKDISKLSPDRVAASGIVRSFQQTAIFQKFTVLQNIVTGFHLESDRSILKSIFQLPGFQNQERNIEKKAMGILKFMGLGHLSSELAGSLPYGQQKALGIGVALAASPKLLLLDEPVAGMNAQEMTDMMAHINNLQKEGYTTMVVEHAMRVVMGICDRIIVVNFGEKIAEGTPREIQENGQVIEAYLGVKKDAANG